MIALLRLNGIDVWQLAGWTMLHYLWLGMLAGLAAGALRLVLRRASANVRYVAALGCLTVLAALPVAIGAWESAAPQAMQMPANSVPAPSAEIAASAPGSAGGLADVIAPIRSMETTPSVAHELLVNANAGSNPRQSRELMDVAAIVAAYLPWLWILGAPLTFLLLTTGVIGSERLRRSSRIIHDGPIAEACTRLVESLRIGRSVTVAVCERVVAPVLVGIVRPMILLPPAALTGWSPDEIEMVLLHELAHVRRWDNLVNLAQRLVEALLFFHPAVWLVSSWVRREREACCDAVVVSRTNRPHAYAELLLNLAAHIREPSEPGRPRPRSNAFRRGRGRPGSLVSSAMAAGPLRGRIRRILQLEDDPMLISGKSLAVVMSGLLLAATLVVLNLPSRTQAEESTTENTEKADLSVRDAGEDRAATQNNLKNLLLALLNYNDAEHGFPAVANFDANGRALLSWRVHLLPYLGEEALYKEFHLDEPWDSEHNRSLITRMPKVFQNPRIDRPGVTNYLAVVGEECMFDDTAKGIRLAQVSDGTANTIAIVEANADRAVEWTSPRDWRFDREHPTAGLGTMWSGYWYAAWVDGHISQVLNSESPDHVGIQFTRACGERNSLAESVQNGGEEGTVGGGRGMAVIGEIGMSQSAEVATSRFPSLEDQKFTEVPFVVGASRFKNGDKIEILEVRGTAETIKPGNIYWIKGSYTLGSRDRAMLAAYTTAKDAANGISPSLTVQSTNVDRGEGTFTLFLPMSYRGWPHVSFYPTDGGEGFGGIYFGTGDSVLENWSEVYGSDDTRSAESHAKVDRGKFPSLEDQKLADKIYRRMGLELEPIGEEDLKRVKALGYDGGLKSTHGAGGIQWSDILVGLHVWPTTRLKDVVDILNRDDLTELNPLKFYVVHRNQQYPDGSVGDEVVTGRISVNVAADPAPINTGPRADRRGPSLSDSATRPPRVVAATPMPIPLGSMKSSESATPRDRLLDEVLAADPNLEMMQQELMSLEYQLNAQAGRTKTDGSRELNQLKMQIAAMRKGIAVYRRQIQEHLANANQLKATLRYDGKTFDEWRTAWQTELSLEKRLEVVKALAAFGASGRGREAAEAILEVAAQLDWAFIGDNSAGRLQQACIDAFTSGEMTEGYRIPTEAWWPLVVPIYENSPEKSTIVKYLANQLPAGETSLIPKLIELSNQSEATRSLALIGLKAVDPSLADDRVVARLRQSLTEADASPEQLRWAIHNLLFSPSGNYSGGMGQDLQLRMVPELQPLLFHPDLEVRQSARFVITKAQPKDAVALVERLKQIIDTQGSGRERQEAIRALAALGQRAMPAEDSLQAIAIDPKDPARIAAGAALLAMWPDIVNWSSADKMNKLFGPGAIERGDWGDVMRKLQAEQQEIYGRYQQTSVGGGGGFF